MFKLKHFLFSSLIAISLTSCDINFSFLEEEQVEDTSFTVIFYGNGGTLVSGKETQTVTKASEIIAPTYTKEGFTFNGWDKTLSTITSDTTIKAEWNVIVSPIETYTVTFNTNGGTSIPSQTVEKGKQSIRPDNPTKDSLIFINWYKDEAFQNIYHFTDTITSDITLFAKWETENVGECTYEFNSDTNSYTVSGVVDKTCNTYNILSTYNSFPVTSIGRSAFYLCSKLSSITIPNSITIISNNSFQYCLSLSSITIPNSVTTIGDFAFSHCESATYVIISQSVTSIGNCAFTGCVFLTSISIPNGVSSIGDGAFDDCISLTSIIISQSVTSIGSGAFRGCKSISSIIVDSKNAIYDSRDNCNAIIKKEINSLILGCKNTIIPDTVTSIGDYAFSDCVSLASITINDNVSSFGLCVFNGCTSLSSIVIPRSIFAASYGVFCNCTSLSLITYLGTQEEWESLTVYDLFPEVSQKIVIHCSDGDIFYN